ncbi:tetratricopeptide repeat protein [Thalassobacillus hwangdonensis]|uniref:Tetratricopeptide repeat protein n=1 Tax=Thalassobacillus hwangdonensis TaxID=546108 RepID=A0ABW3L2T1_9BACI
MRTSENATVEQVNNKVITFVPNGDLYFSYGVQAFQKRKFDLAEKWLKMALEKSPEEALYACQLSVIYTEQGSYHAANQVLTEVLSQHGTEYIDCYYLIANNYAHLGLFNDAKKYAEKYLEKSEDEGEFKEAADQLLELIHTLSDEEDDEWALDDEDDLLIYQETAFYHIQHQEWDKALVVLEEMMQLFPDYTTAKHEYTFALFYQGDQKGAIELEQRWLEKDPENLNSHVNLAIFFKERNETEQCEYHVQILRNIYPIHDQQKLYIAQTLTVAGYYEEAYQRFKMIRSRDIKQAKAFYKWHSVACYHNGYPSKALQLWEQGCRKYPALSNEGGPWSN